MKTKGELRKLMMEKRKALSKEEKKELDGIIFSKVIESEYYTKAKIIFVFVSHEDEVDTIKIIKHALKNNKIICVPKVISKLQGMEVIEIKSLEDLEPGKFGILEPKPGNNIISAETIDLVLLPGLAFDIDGGRLGYGGGFYDRYLTNITINTPKIGIGYDFQIIDKVTMEKHDNHIDGIITN
jgi:5-formyltetrahydrofolate cyclo-ligase